MNWCNEMYIVNVYCVYFKMQYSEYQIYHGVEY